MRNYLTQYRAFLFFLGKFFLAYLFLTFVYQLFLAQFDTSKFEVDTFTKLVAEQSVFVMRFFDHSAHSLTNFSDVSVKLFYNSHYVSRVVEGCNALSVIILFVSFVIAFSGKWKPTLLYILGGSLLIHFCNVLRIGFLSILMFNYPKQKQLLHGVLFPLLIYGVVFILWIIWVNKFSNYAKK